MRSVGILSVVFVAALTVGAIAGGEHFGHGSTGELHQMMDHMMQRIGATEAQRSQLEAAHERHDATVKRLRAAMDEAHQRLATAIHSEVFDEAAIRAAAADYAAAQADMFVARAELFQDARRILTPDQLEQLKGMHGHDGHGMHGETRGHGACSGDCGGNCDGSCGGAGDKDVHGHGHGR